jgi:hypothetical protein
MTIGCWRLDRPGEPPQFFDTPIAAVAAMPNLGAEHVIWQDWFDYPRYSVGRVA